MDKIFRSQAKAVIHSGIYTLVIFLLTAVSDTRAGTIVWTNTAGGNWSNPLNWSPNLVPGQLNSTSNTDDVLITNAGSYIVNFDVGDTTNFWGVHSITAGALGFSGAPWLQIQNGTTLQAATITINSLASLSVASSAIQGAVTMMANSTLYSHLGNYYGPVAIAGFANFNGDWFYQPLTINSGAIATMVAGMSLLGASSFNGQFRISSGSLALAAPLTNSGTITFSAGSYGGNGISIVNDGSTNYQGGLVNLPGGVINMNNAATYGIYGPFGQGYFINHGVLTCTNSGTVNIASFDNTGGTVTNWSGALTLGNFSNTNAFTGSFYAASGGSIGFEGGTPTNPLAPGPAPAFHGPGGFAFMSGWLLLTNDIITNLQLDWGNLELGPHFQGGSITNLTFFSMYLTNSLLPVTGIMTVTGSAAQIYGNMTVASGGLVNLYGTCHGVVTVTSNATVNSFQGSFANDCAVTINGTLNMSTSTYASGETTNFGVMNLSGFLYLGQLVNQPAGAINISTNASIQTSQTGSVLINNGTIMVGSGNTTAAINVTDFTNAGAITAQSGTLQLNHVTLLPAGSLNTTLNSLTNYGKFTITGAATLTGMFGATLAMNYAPKVGDSFQPLTYGSNAGAFTATNLPPWDAWQTSYGSTALTLQVTVTNLPPAFTKLAYANGSIIFSGINGTPGAGYWVLAGTNLEQPLSAWLPVTTNLIQANGQFGFTNSLNATQSAEYFILKLQ